jgi:hypothetical protein
MRNETAEQDTIYVIAYNYQQAKTVATMEWGYTGNGLDRGQGPRPWVYLRDDQSMRGRMFAEREVRWVEGWWKRVDAEEIVGMMQHAVRLP